MKPFVKWAGGKRQILELIKEKIRNSTTYDNKDSFTFIEPFVGGGVVFLSLAHNKTIINDLNFELITTYKVIKKFPEELMRKLDEHYANFIERGEEYYYQIRGLDRNPDFFKTTDVVSVAARMIFLNKTCYNGLYRVNSSGYFNTPIGRNRFIGFYDRKNILAISKYLNSNDVQIRCGSYLDILKLAGPGDVIYLDPPYDYKEDDGFTQYQKTGFTFDDFVELKCECDKALERGAYVIISNNYTEKVVNQFRQDLQHNYEVFDIYALSTKRSINCKGDLRKTGEEILIWGIPCKFPYIKDVEQLFPIIKIRDKSKISDFEFLRKRFNKRLSDKSLLHIISSLKFLGILDNKNDFTEAGIELRKHKLGSDEFKKCFAKIIVNNWIFGRFYTLSIAKSGWELSEEEIFEVLQKDSPNVSQSFLRKRAIIISTWINWAKDKLN